MQPAWWCSVLSEAPGLGGGELADPADDMNQLQVVPMTALGLSERGDEVIQEGAGGVALHLDAHGDVRAQEVDRISVEHAHPERCAGPSSRPGALPQGQRQEGGDYRCRRQPSVIRPAQDDRTKRL